MRIVTRTSPRHRATLPRCFKSCNPTQSDELEEELKKKIVQNSDRGFYAHKSALNYKGQQIPNGVGRQLVDGDIMVVEKGENKRVDRKTKTYSEILTIKRAPSYQ